MDVYYQHPQDRPSTVEPYFYFFYQQKCGCYYSMTWTLLASASNLKHRVIWGIVNKWVHFRSPDLCRMWSPIQIIGGVLYRQRVNVTLQTSSSYDPVHNYQSEKEYLKVWTVHGFSKLRKWVMNITMYLLAFISLDIFSALARVLSSSFYLVEVTERHLVLIWLLYKTISFSFFLIIKCDLSHFAKSRLEGNVLWLNVVYISGWDGLVRLIEAQHGV